MDEAKKGQLGLPFVRFAPFLTAGSLTAYFGGGLASGIVFALSAAAFVFLAAKRSSASICAAGMLWGMLSMGLYLELYCAPILRLSGETITAEFVVKEVVETGYSREYISEVKLDGVTANVRLSCGEYLEEGWTASGVIALDDPDSLYRIRDLIDEVLLSGEVSELHIIERRKTWIEGCIKQAREELAGEIRKNVFGDGGELALAMLFGMDGDLSPVLRESLKICGAAHFTAVSGTHFTVFSAVILGLIPSSRRKTRFLFSMMFAPAAVLFFGATPSVMRASVMFVIYGLAPIFRRKSDTLNTLCVTVTVIVLSSPATVLDAGFAMSVLGVFGAGVAGKGCAEKLCMLYPHTLGRYPVPVTALMVSIGAVICTSPVSAALFKGVSLTSAFVSIILLPLMSIAMTFAVLLGATKLTFFALPIDITMSAAAAVIKFIGKFRTAWLTLDFEGAWILAALCAAALTAAAFGSKKTFVLSGICMAVLIVLSVSAEEYVSENRSEIWFVGNSNSSAAVIVDKEDAVVLISGNGAGLAANISQTMREHGATRITCIAAFEAGYTGALTIRELADMTEIGAVYTNELALGMLDGINAYAVPRDSMLSVSGVTVAGASVSDDSVIADIVLYHGRIADMPQSPAGTAVYFSSSEKELPENGHNARRDRDFHITLKKGEKIVSIVQ